MPRSLQRPRVDVVLSATGPYRDHFPMPRNSWRKRWNLPPAQEEDNPLWLPTAGRCSANCRRRALPRAAQRARKGAFSPLHPAVTAPGSTTQRWPPTPAKRRAEGDRKLASLYLSKMQFAYGGSDEASWGSPEHCRRQRQGGADQSLRRTPEGTEGAVLSRTSNLYGMLHHRRSVPVSGRHRAAVRMLDGKRPSCTSPSARQRCRQGGRRGGVSGQRSWRRATSHPGYQGLMAEEVFRHAAGARQRQQLGWTTVSREIVRDDQWQEFVEVYVRR